MKLVYACSCIGAGQVVPDLDDHDLGMRAMVDTRSQCCATARSCPTSTLDEMPALMAELALNKRFVSVALGLAVAHVLSQTRAPNKLN
jgi:hypothetical protein